MSTALIGGINELLSTVEEDGADRLDQLEETTGRKEDPAAAGPSHIAMVLAIVIIRLARASTWTRC
jgi:hypothetical protein